MPFMRQCGRQTGHRLQYTIMHTRCMLDNEGYKHTRSEYITFDAFLLQQWLCKHPSML